MAAETPGQALSVETRAAARGGQRQMGGPPPERTRARRSARGTGARDREFDREHVALRTTGTVARDDQAFNLYPVRKIHHTTTRHSARKPSVMPALTTTLTSEMP